MGKVPIKYHFTINAQPEHVLQHGLVDFLNGV